MGSFDPLNAVGGVRPGLALQRTISPGQMLGHYRILEGIGAGGMGVVYRAHDEHLDREVAIKVLPIGALAQQGMRRRFRNEALALSKLNHPNIATIHDFDRAGDIDYLVMEYVAGEKLRDKISAGPLSQQEITSLGMQIADALVAAHDLGVIHRDLKPENVRLTFDGRPKILDFGLAKLIRPLADLDTTETNVSAVAGTLPYMSPEQLLGQAVDHRADLFSFGVVLYEMATAALPFNGSTPSAISDAILHAVPTPAVQLNSSLPPRLDEIIHKALEKDRELRYQDATDIRSDLHSSSHSTKTGLDAAVAAGSQRVAGAEERRRRRKVVPVALIAILLAALAGWSLLRVRTSSTPAAQNETPSVAVLPFVNMSSGVNEEYFSDGLAEELIHDLSRMQGLRVAARTSSFRFRGATQDPHAVGEKLHVRAILEGSVRKEGKRVRITARLINTANGFNVWSEIYDRELSDIFAVQEDIGRSVAASLQGTLLGVASTTPAAQCKNPEAYNAYLQGKYFTARLTKYDLQKAIGYFEQAIKLDPGYAPAWVGLADAYSDQADRGYEPVEDGYRKAREAAERALALDSNLAEAHAAMGWIKASYEWDWTGADTCYERALALAPGNAVVGRRAAVLQFTLGRYDQAILLYRRAVEVDPLSASTYNNLGNVNYYAGRLNDAAAAYKKSLELNPQFAGVHVLLGRVALEQGHPQKALAEMEQEPDATWRGEGLALTYYALGRKKEADAALVEYVARYRADAAFQIAEIYAFRNDTDKAFEWLERAYTQRDAGLNEINGDPLLRNLEHDPRYAAFLKKMRLPTGLHQIPTNAFGAPPLALCAGA